jgi:ribosomal 30S subunit maturation factor RimM
VGTVGGFFATGANDVLVLWVDDDPEDELFVPMIEDAIAEIDDSAPRVTLRPLDDWAPEGTEL